MAVLSPHPMTTRLADSLQPDNPCISKPRPHEVRPRTRLYSLLYGLQCLCCSHELPLIRLAVMAQSAHGLTGVGTPMALPARIAGVITQAESLWDEAFRSLGEDDRQQLEPLKANKLGALDKALRAVEEKKRKCLEQRWTFKKPNGERVILRDLCEKVIVWIGKFKEVGDAALQYDPGHAALPWAGIRFILQALINDREMFCAMIEQVEHVAYVITRCTIIEALYLNTSLGQKNDLANCLADHPTALLRGHLVSLYASVLRFLAKAGNYYNKGTSSRMVRSIFVPPEVALKDPQDAILKQEEQVRLDLRLIEHDALRVVFDQNNETHLKIEKLRQDLEDPIRRFASQLSQIETKMKKENQQELLRWLSRVRFAEHHKFVSKTRMDGTGAWIFDKHCFNEWRKSSSSLVLWLHGIPGSGKTNLVSLIIDTLMRNNTGASQMELCAFFYCSRDPAEPERSDPDEVMRCILKQLCSRTANKPIRPPVVNAYLKWMQEAEDDGLDPSKLCLQECTDLIIELLDQDPAIIIIDALDECDPARRYQLLEALDRIIQESSSLVKLFVSSRDDGDIKQRLEKSHNIYIDASDNSDDIETFIRHELDDAIKGGRLLGGKVSVDLQNHIYEKLTGGAHGMFRWVSLQIQNICDARRFKLAEDIKREIGKLPKSLEDSYDSIYNSIQSLSSIAKLVSKRAISWLLCTSRPLREPEFIAAITIDGLKEPISTEQILDICCNLVVYDSASELFRFAHLSVREYLERRPEYSLAEIHFEACYACLKTWNIPKVQRKDLPQGWVRYAAQYSLLHLQELEFAGVPDPGGLDDNLQRFIDVDADDYHPYLDWVEHCNWMNRFYYLPGFDLPHFAITGEIIEVRTRYSHFTLSHPLSLFAALGNSFIMKRILQKGMLRLSQEQKHECIRAAALCGNITALRVLISNGFSFLVDLILYIFKNIPYFLPTENSKDLKYLSKDLILIILETTSKITKDMFDAACANESDASCSLVQALFIHDPMITIGQRQFETVVSRKNTKRCRLFLSWVPQLTITEKVFEQYDLIWRKEESATCVCTLLSIETNVKNTTEALEAVERVCEEPGPFKCLTHRTKFEKQWTVQRMLRNVVGSHSDGERILAALLHYNEELVMKHAPLDVMVKFADPESIIQFLSIHRDAPVTTDILVDVMRKEKEHALTIFQLLIDQERTHSRSIWGLRRLIDEVMNSSFGLDFMKLLLAQTYFKLDEKDWQYAIRTTAARNKLDIALLLLHEGVDIPAADVCIRNAIRIADHHGNHELATQLRMWMENH